ncbi:MAG: sensor domain-containing diguanylate cyclase [Candidatus Omnitrophota bacterium]
MTSISMSAEKEFKVLYEISCAMRTTLELPHILYIILTGVTSHSGLGYNRALLFLFNEQKNRLECRMAIGPKSGEHANKIWEFIDKENQKLEDLIHADKVKEAASESALFHEYKDLVFPLEVPTLLNQAYQRGLPWHLTPEETELFKDDPLLKSFSTYELVIMPLKAQDKVNGLIVADNIYTKKPISQHDIQFFTMLANQAGLAIENARLYEIVVQQSMTDALTGLWNHGYFQKTLLNELPKAKRYETPLTLLFLDIDDFKKFNDTCGHQHGDLILKEIAKILRDSSRAQDCICRYGGEELALILSNTTSEQGFETAERIRKRIDEYGFPSPSGMGALHLTVSIGLATFPQHAEDKDALITHADKAMYEAKKSGKNKTCMP